MGKSSKPTIGYWHSMGLYMGECSGPVDALREIRVGDEVAWIGNLTASGTISIHKPQLFGGEKKEGGIDGVLEVRMGEATQMPSAYLQDQVLGPWPAGRGLFTTVFNGVVGAMNPYIKLWKKKVSRWQMGWNTPVWQPTLAKVGEGMNPAHIIYECLTDPDCGLGYSPTAIDTASFLAAALTLKDENFGLCLKWSRSEVIGNFIQVVCDHIGGQWSEDPRTNKITLTLFRGNYDPALLPLIDESSIVKMESWAQTALDSSVNEVTVVGRDCNTNKDFAVTFQNLANVQAQGRVVSQKKQFPGLWNVELGARVAARETMTSSSLLCRVKVTVKRTLWGIKRGDVYALSWGRKGVVRMPMRVIDVDEGTLTDSAIGLVLAQDIFGLPATTYIAPVGTGWTPPDYSPKPVPAQLLLEASYRDLSANMRPADLAQVAPDAGYVAAFGARPSGVAYNYALSARVGAAAFAEVGSGDFSPTGLLSAVLGVTDTTLTLTGGRDLDLVKVGTEAMIDAEKMRVTSINPQSGAVSIARGCVDTVPVEHASGARMWFTDTYFGTDPTEYVDGETVDGRLLTRTSEGELDLTLAPITSVTLDQRQYRPYPPGKFAINGAAEPMTAFARLGITWAHRDRLLQADQLVDTEVASIGPEPGTTYTVRIYQQPSTLVHTATGIAADNYTYDIALVADASIRVEVESVRAGLASLQKHVRIIACECGNKIRNATFASDTEWTKGAGWTIAGGVAARAAGTASDLSQAITLEAGGTYRVECALSGVTEGSVTAGFTGGTAVDGATRAASGSYTETLTAVAGNNTFRFAADAAFTGSVDNVVVRRLS